MNSVKLSLDDIVQLTLRDGEEWAVAHARRLLKLIRVIGMGFEYDPTALALAAYLHDWGAFPRYAQKDVDHALRSRQVAEADILPYMDLAPATKQVVLEAIELHDYLDMRLTRSPEALLLREADILEFLGVIGMAREFARGPKNVEICYRRILDRHNGAQGRLTIPRAWEMGQVRLARMEQNLHWLGEESFGIL